MTEEEYIEAEAEYREVMNAILVYDGTEPGTEYLTIQNPTHTSKTEQFEEYVGWLVEDVIYNNRPFALQAVDSNKNTRHYTLNVAEELLKNLGLNVHRQACKLDGMKYKQATLLISVNPMPNARSAIYGASLSQTATIQLYRIYSNEDPQTHDEESMPVTVYHTEPDLLTGLKPGSWYPTRPAYIVT